MESDNPIRLAGYQGPASILSASLQSLAAELETHFDGAAVETDINVTSRGESAASLFASVDRGARQLCYVASGYLVAAVPELAALDLPFAVSDRTTALDALDGAAGEALTRAVESRTGYKVLGYWDNGFRHISNAVRPVHSPADCQGLTIRTLDSAVYRDALAALGFTPRSIDVKDLVRVVQNHEVDAQENPLTNTFHFGLFQHHPYLSLTGHFFGVLLLVCHRAWFASLTTERQTIVVAAAARATALQRDKAAREDDALLGQIRAAGTQVLPASALDLDAMRRATRHITDRVRTALPQAVVHGYLDRVLHRTLNTG